MRKKRNPILHKEDYSGALSALFDTSVKDVMNNLSLDEISFHLAKEITLLVTFLVGFRQNFNIMSAIILNDSSFNKLINNLTPEEKRILKKIRGSLTRSSVTLAGPITVLREEAELLVRHNKNAVKKLEQIIYTDNYKPFSINKLMKDRLREK